MNQMELLAPVGTLENFHAALDAGADAVYVGAPGFNARNPAKEFRLQEIGAMIAHCHRLGKKIYLAANSLVLERELPSVIESLAVFEQLEPDALIIQDTGLIQLVRKYFPSLKLHASTLATVHNSEGVLALGELGCERVVLARELTLKEIAAIAARCEGVDLEIFVHGAMCFSYSGLCLFSSYLGGKSGLRGRCVQPCRRAYRTEKGSGRRSGSQARGKYLFSMNDLNGLEQVTALKDIGIHSLKIEGRLRSAHYVHSIVAAYRTVLDAESENLDQALQRARDLTDKAMGRTACSGYFLSPQPAEAISHHFSGNMGLHLGKFSAVRLVGAEQICRFVTKSEIEVGDRLRLHLEPSGDRKPFRLKSLFVEGQEGEKGEAGTRISITLPKGFELGSNSFVDVYKVDGSGGGRGRQPLEVQRAGKLLRDNQRRIQVRFQEVLAQCGLVSLPPDREVIQKPSASGGRLSRGFNRANLDLWLKTDSTKLLFSQMPFSPVRYLLSFEKHNLSQAGKIKSGMGKRSRMVIWALPPLIMENDLARVKKQLRLLLNTGFRSFQLGHFSQSTLFAGEKVHLFGDYTLNLMNSQAVSLYAESGLDSVQLSPEVNGEDLKEIANNSKWSDKSFKTGQEKRKIQLGLTVYGRPALYTSRLAAKHFQYDQVIKSPRDERYYIKKKEGYTQIFAEKPFSLLPYLGELQGVGIDYGIVDVCGGISKREMMDLAERLKNNGRYSKLSTFNYLGKLE